MWSSITAYYHHWYPCKSFLHLLVLGPSKSNSTKHSSTCASWTIFSTISMPLSCWSSIWILLYLLHWSSILSLSSTYSLTVHTHYLFSAISIDPCVPHFLLSDFSASSYLSNCTGSVWFSSSYRTGASISSSCFWTDGL